MATYIGSIPRISAAPATAGCTGTSRLAHDHRHARGARQLVEHRGHAAARRVAHAAQLPGPAASSSASTAGHSERVSDSTVGVELELAAREHDRRAVVADRARDEDAVARAQAPRATARARASTRADAGGAEVHRVGVAALDDLGVAGDDLARRPAAAAAAIASTSARSVVGGEALLEHHATRLSASGRAPATARSLTVPLTASSPIEPPGKRIGLTTKLSVVSASATPPIDDACRRRRAPRARRRAEGGHEQALDQRLRRLAARAVGHRDVLVLEPRRAWRARSR